MNSLIDVIVHHLAAAGFGGGALLIAIICTMPTAPPGFIKRICSQEMWEWIRNSLQTVVPAARHPGDPTLPEDTAQPKN